MAKGPKLRRRGRMVKMGMYDDLNDDRLTQYDIPKDLRSEAANDLIAEPIKSPTDYKAENFVAPYSETAEGMLGELNE